MTVMAAPSDVPVLDEDPYSTDNLRDPRTFHHRLREAGPLVWLSRHGVYATGRYAQVRAGLSQFEQLISSAGVGLEDLRTGASWRPASLMIEADPPAHTPRRELLARILSPRALRSLREPFAAAADQLVDRVLAADSVDGVRDLAEAFPLEVFPAAVGLDESVRPHLLVYGNLGFNTLGPDNEILRQAREGVGPTIEAIMAQTAREALRVPGLGALLWQAADDGVIPADEAPMLVRSLLTAGVDTTVASLGAALHGLAADPQQWQLLRADPGRAKFVFEEAIRFDSPVQTFYRTSVQDTDLDGAHLPADQKVMLSLAGANRDPRQFSEPDRFDMARNVAGHVGFGWGIHQCVGQHLGRMEGEALLGALARKVATLELAGEPERRLNNTLHAWGTLPLRITAA